MPLPTHRDLDQWLTELPDDELQRLHTACNQFFEDALEDRAPLTRIISLILHFCGKPALRIDEIIELIVPFALYLRLETLVRKGDVIKEGKYSIVEGEDDAVFTMTEQGKAKQGNP